MIACDIIAKCLVQCRSLSRQSTVTGNCRPFPINPSATNGTFAVCELHFVVCTFPGDPQANRQELARARAGGRPEQSGGWFQMNSNINNNNWQGSPFWEAIN